MLLSQLSLLSPCSQLPLHSPWQVYGCLMANTAPAWGSLAVPPLVTGNSTPKWLHSSAAHSLISLEVECLFPLLTTRYSALKSAHHSLFRSQTVHYLSGLFLLTATDSSVKIKQPFNLLLAMITISGVKEQLPGSASSRPIKGSQSRKQSYTKLSFQPIQVHDA